MMPSLPAAESRLEENKRLGRVLRIVQLIAANPKGWTRARLAEHFELSTRQIDKDIEMIRHALRYELNRASTGYYFDSGPLLKPIQLDLAEALALSVAAQQGRDTGSVERPAVASALSKLEEALPAEVVPYLRRAGEATAFQPVQARAERAVMLTTLERTLIEQREIRCSYSSASHGGEIAQRTLQPYHLMPYHQSWMLIAFDQGRREVLMFNVDRIHSCDVTNTVYAIPDDFDLQEYIGPAWGILRGEPGAVEHVVLRFNAEAAAWVRDHQWHYTQRTEEAEDGSLVMHFRCIVTNELIRWVLSFGGRVIISQPDRLRKAVTAEAQAVIDR